MGFQLTPHALASAGVDGHRGAGAGGRSPTWKRTVYGMGCKLMYVPCRCGWHYGASQTHAAQQVMYGQRLNCFMQVWMDITARVRAALADLEKDAPPNVSQLQPGA